MIRAASSEPYPYRSSRTRAARWRGLSVPQHREARLRARPTSSNGSRTYPEQDLPDSPACGARPHPGAVQRHLEQVGGQIVDPVDPVPTLPDLQERLLHEVGGIGPVPGDEVQGLDRRCSRSSSKNSSNGPMSRRVRWGTSRPRLLLARTMDARGSYSAEMIARRSPLPIFLLAPRVQIGLDLLNHHVEDLLELSHWGLRCVRSTARPCVASARTVDGRMPMIRAASSEP